MILTCEFIEIGRANPRGQWGIVLYLPGCLMFEEGHITILSYMGPMAHPPIFAIRSRRGFNMPFPKARFENWRPDQIEFRQWRMARIKSSSCSGRTVRGSRSTLSSSILPITGGLPARS